MAGEFLIKFFEEHVGALDIKHNNEADVLCPFEHDKGYEKRPSAHVNTDKGVFHCKTCSAEGRFMDGGLSEAGFVSHYYNVSYAKAIKMLTRFTEKAEVVDNWEEAVNVLLSNDKLMEYLNSRGITEELAKEYQLGSVGDGIIYPVFMNGVIIDKRTYNINPEPGEPKIRSQSGSSPLLFPFDHWKNDDRPTLLTAGENDTLLARKMGFNAVTSTFGEGSFPEMFVGLFKNKDVYICYDCDEAGKRGSLKVAFLLHEAGAKVHLVDLGLPGTKDDKDITDFFIKHNHTSEDLYQKIENSTLYTGEMYNEEKNERYPLVNLWEVPHGKYSGNKRISSRVLMMGKFDMPMEAPTAIEWECTNPNLTSESSPCHTCPFNSDSGWWTLDEDNLYQLLELVEVDSQKQQNAIKRFIGLPHKCPGVRMDRREKQHIQKVIFSPDVETEDELSGFRSVEHHAYTIGLDLEDGQRYRAFFKRYPHPKTQAIVSVVDYVEDSDNAVNTFKLTPEVIQDLSQFQGHPDEVMEKRFKTAKEIVGSFVNRQVIETVDLIYHSVLDFKYANDTMKGHPEALVIGESRTGKSSVAKKWQQFLGLGNLTECKTATTAGLLGGADKLPSGAHRITWGKIPRNHKGLLVLDELSGMSQNVLASMTGLRSERTARLEKIVSGIAPAKTRLLWISNPRVGSNSRSRSISEYPTGVEIVLDLVGSDEDVARFDFVVILPPNETYISPLTKEELDEVQNKAYRQLVHWVWSRKADQIKFNTGVQEYIWQVAQELNEKYDTDVKFFGAEAHKKLARICVSIAAMCFSHDGTGESILVAKEHVDWAKNFLIRCYDNDVFRLSEYVEETKMTRTTNEEVNAAFAGLVHAQPMLMKTISRHSEISLFQLQAMTGLDKNDFQSAISNLAQHGMVQTTRNGIMPTLRFRKARDAYVKNIDGQKLTPLSQGGGLPI